MKYYCVQRDDGIELGGICELLETDGNAANLCDSKPSRLISYWDESFEEFGDLVSVGGVGRPMVVSQRFADALGGLRLPEKTMQKLVDVYDDVNGMKMETLTAIMFPICYELMSQANKNEFLSAGILRFSQRFCSHATKKQNTRTISRRLRRLVDGVGTSEPECWTAPGIRFQPIR